MTSCALFVCISESRGVKQQNVFSGTCRFAGQISQVPERDEKEEKSTCLM